MQSSFFAYALAKGKRTRTFRSSRYRDTPPPNRSSNSGSRSRSHQQKIAGEREPMEIKLHDGTCWICGSRADSLFVTRGWHGLHQRCEQCGEFKISISAGQTVDKYKWTDKALKLSGWVRRQTRDGNAPTLFSNMLEGIVNSPMPSRQERLDSLLMELADGQTGAGSEIDITLGPRF